MLKSRLLPMMILALTVSAQAAYADDNAKAENAEPAKEKKICKTERMTGSRTRVTRICMTSEQWDKLAEATAKSVNDINAYQNRPDRLPSDPQKGQGF
ncbi:MAG: hypothetical protein J7494_02665 [Sphingobium sp.]|nr:hypothetical protein [Sphingobium sp.]